jgi:Mg2+ and Co2+ transporter CorA
MLMLSLVVCLGYNTLHNVHTNKATDHDDELDNSQDTPHAKRVWNWLLLCEDKTVISISENPFPFSEDRLQAHELRTLYTTRRNLVSVFRQLTKSPTPLRESSFIMLPIRHRIGNSDEETAHRNTDAPGLLFYYLFEDWFTTYSLVTRRERGYAAELDRLRREMLVRANLTHVDQLHHIGCQLSVLKRVYQSYELIIERVLKKQEATLASLKNSHILSAVDSLASSMPMGSPQIHEADSLLGVSLSSAARVRFERLRDRIILYALSEIQECIDQKDSLVMMVSFLAPPCTLEANIC